MVIVTRSRDILNYFDRGVSMITTRLIKPHWDGTMQAGPVVINVGNSVVTSQVKTRANIW